MIQVHVAACDCGYTLWEVACYSPLEEIMYILLCAWEAHVGGSYQMCSVSGYNQFRLSLTYTQQQFVPHAKQSIILSVWLCKIVIIVPTHTPEPFCVIFGEGIKRSTLNSIIVYLYYNNIPLGNTAYMHALESGNCGSPHLGPRWPAQIKYISSCTSSHFPFLPMHNQIVLFGWESNSISGTHNRSLARESCRQAYRFPGQKKAPPSTQCLSSGMHYGQGIMLQGYS